MSRALGRSMPARLALDFRDVGEVVALAVLGMGVIENGGPHDDERVANGYRDMVEDTEPATIVSEFYADEIKAHPWMEAPLEPAMVRFASPDDDLHDKVTLVAGVLKSQSIRGCEEWAEIDLLGRVMLEMTHLAHRRKRGPGYYAPLVQNAAGALFERPEEIAMMGTMTDYWCGSGMRAIGAATAMRAIGRDPEKIRWTLMDADPMARMITAINCRAFDLGENIEVRDGSEYKEAMLAAGAKGLLPQMAAAGMPIDPEAWDPHNIPAAGLDRSRHG